MSNALFGGSFPTDEHCILSVGKSSRSNSIASNKSASRSGSLSLSIVSSLVHNQFMNEALAEARAGFAEGGIPIGCVLVHDGKVVARGHNRRIQRNSAILHAEMDCLESCGRKTPEFYKQCTLYTTLSPCAMCSGAIRLYGIPHVVIGENKTFLGDEELLQKNHVHIDLLHSNDCYDLLQNYIKENGSTWFEDIGKDKH